MTEEIERRIEAAFAAGEATLVKCEACLATEPTSTYRPEWADEEEPVVVYCDECAEELGLK